MSGMARSKRIDAQMPTGEEIFLDHVGFFVPDLTVAGDQLRRLGFQVSAINVQYNAEEDGELVLTGTSNRLAKFQRGFLEVLAATSETPLAEQLTQALERYQGLHVIALTHPDMEAQRERLIQAGFPMQPLVHLRRRVNDAGQDTQMAYSVLRTKPDVMAEGRVQLLTTHTPELFWTPGVTVHRNQAEALTELLLCVEDPLEAVERYGRFTGRTPVRADRFGIIALDRGRLLFVDPHMAADMLPGFTAIPALLRKG